MLVDPHDSDRIIDTACDGRRHEAYPGNPDLLKVIRMMEHRRGRATLMALAGLAILIALTSPTMGQQGGAAAGAAPQATVANSQYDNWAPFHLGASSTLTMIDVDAAGAVISDAVQTQTITALSDEALTLATQVQYAGQTPSDIVDVAVPAMLPPAGPTPAGMQTTTVVSPNPQSITVPAGTFQCTLTTTSTTVVANGQTFSTIYKVWSSDTVPGSVVKVVSEASRPTGDSVMTYELIAYVIGKAPVPQKMEPNPEYAKWASFPAGASATLAQATFDSSGVKVGNSVIVWTLSAVSADSVTVSDTNTTSPGTPDEFTCSSGDTDIPAMVPVGSNTPLATTVTVVAAATEIIDVPAGKFDCRLTTTTTTVPMAGGQVCTIVTKEWESDKVPGALVKSTSLLDVGTGAITSVMELTAFAAK
jgi:hypothetical protein